MRLALEQERKGRELLVGELAKTRRRRSRQQALLSEREQQVQTFQQELQQKEQQTAQLAAATEAISSRSCNRRSSKPRSLSSNKQISCSSLPPPRPMSKP